MRLQLLYLNSTKRRYVLKLCISESLALLFECNSKSIKDYDAVEYYIKSLKDSKEVKLYVRNRTVSLFVTALWL